MRSLYVWFRVAPKERNDFDAFVKTDFQPFNLRPFPQRLSRWCYRRLAIELGFPAAPAARGRCAVLPPDSMQMAA